MRVPSTEAIWFQQQFEAIRAEVGKSVVGQDLLVTNVLTGLVTEGHVLLEGLPGLGKTLLVRSLAQALDLDFGRLQFTPDMMPADVTGTNILSNDGARNLEFRRGPIFANLVLADEINRATPKTQSAMLEAMQEAAVTVGGKRHQLDTPFLVMATQNPIEQEGTYPLPEAQLDRFLFKLYVPFPTKEELGNIVSLTTGGAHTQPQPVANKQALAKMKEYVTQVEVSREVLDFALELILATHPELPTSPETSQRYLRYGSSPRGAQGLIKAAKATALADGRLNAAKEDVLAVSMPVLRHRIGLNFEAEADGMTADTLIKNVQDSVVSKDRDPIRR